MIFYRLKGGLCNMMFQIAAVTAIAKKRNTEASFLNIDEQLKYLNDDSFYNPNVNYCFDYKNLNFFKNLKTIPEPSYISTYEYPFHFQEAPFLEQDKHVLGFFQSEKYFQGYENLIKYNFRPTDEVINFIKQKYPNVFDKKITSIHVRRGDYLRLPNHHPTQSVEYYQKAIDLTKNTTDYYFVFSDDIEWCKQTFNGNKFVFIEHNKDYVDLYLMSLCYNNIISNSSFGWWGAWLNNNPNKMVIAPQKWFGSSFDNFNTCDIIPDKWIKL